MLCRPPLRRRLWQPGQLTGALLTVVSGELRPAGAVQGGQSDMTVLATAL